MPIVGVMIRSQRCGSWRWSRDRGCNVECMDRRQARGECLGHAR